MIDPYELGLTVGKIKGHEASVLCPYHGDRHFGNASINLITGKFHCFSCGANSSAKRIAKLLDGNVVTTFSVKSADRVEEDWEWMFSAPIATHNDYLKSRKVPKMLIAHLGIRDIKDGIAFILHDENGRPIGAQVRWINNRVPRYKLFGKRPAIWPWRNVIGISKKEITYLVEGVFGVIRGMQAGLSVVSVMGASSIKDAAIALNGRKVRIIFDDDFAGYVGAAKFMRLRASEVLLPGCEADEISVLEWINIAKRGSFTSSVNDVMRASGDPAHFKSLVYPK